MIPPSGTPPSNDVPSAGQSRPGGTRVMFDERLTVTRTKSPPYGLILGGGCGIVVLAVVIGALVAYLLHLDGWGLADVPSPSAKPAASGKLPAGSASGKVKR